MVHLMSALKLLPSSGGLAPVRLLAQKAHKVYKDHKVFKEQLV